MMKDILLRLTDCSAEDLRESVLLMQLILIQFCCFLPSNGWWNWQHQRKKAVTESIAVIQNTNQHWGRQHVQTTLWLYKDDC